MVMLYFIEWKARKPWKVSHVFVLRTYRRNGAKAVESVETAACFRTWQEKNILFTAIKSRGRLFSFSG